MRDEYAGFFEAFFGNSSADESSVRRNVTYEIVTSKSRAYQQVEQELGALPSFPLFIYCPSNILSAFRELVRRYPQLLGAKVHNQYTGRVEFLPFTPEEFTPKHLQLLTRVDSFNTDGIIRVEPYKLGLNSSDTVRLVAQLRALVTETVGTCTAMATHYGGYPASNPRCEIPGGMQVVVTDEIGYQAQQSFFNTLGLFFYPDVSNRLLPQGYLQWQNSTFKYIYGVDRPTSPTRALDVEWSEEPISFGREYVPGKLDLKLFSAAISVKFLRSLAAANFQAKQSGIPNLFMKYLKAGLGHFISGLKAIPPVLNALEIARLKGILHALQYIEFSDTRDTYLSNIGGLSFPFSAELNSKRKVEEVDELVKGIQEYVSKLGLMWGGAGIEDALAPVDGFPVIGPTTCPDPHVGPGNEGSFESVDAAIAGNVRSLARDGNAAANPNITCFCFADESPLFSEFSEEREACDVVSSVHVISVLSGEVRNGTSGDLGDGAAPGGPEILGEGIREERIFNMEATNELKVLLISMAPWDDGKTVALKKLLDVGGDPNVASEVCTGLMALVERRGTVEPAVETLLKAGAEPDKRVVPGGAALYVAVEAKKFKVIRLLLKAGANPNLPDEVVGTPLQCAVRMGCEETVGMLVRYGALENVAPEALQELLNRASTDNIRALLRGEGDDGAAPGPEEGEGLAEEEEVAVVSSVVSAGAGAGEGEGVEESSMPGDGGGGDAPPGSVEGDGNPSDEGGTASNTEDAEGSTDVKSVRTTAVSVGHPHSKLNGIIGVLEGIMDHKDAIKDTICYQLFGISYDEVIARGLSITEAMEEQRKLGKVQLLPPIDEAASDISGLVTTERYDISGNSEVNVTNHLAEKLMMSDQYPDLAGIMTEGSSSAVM